MLLASGDVPCPWHPGVVRGHPSPSSPIDYRTSTIPDNCMVLTYAADPYRSPRKRTPHQPPPCKHTHCIIPGPPHTPQHIGDCATRMTPRSPPEHTVAHCDAHAGMTTTHPSPGGTHRITQQLQGSRHPRFQAVNRVGHLLPARVGRNVGTQPLNLWMPCGAM